MNRNEKNFLVQVLAWDCGAEPDEWQLGGNGSYWDAIDILKSYANKGYYAEVGLYDQNGLVAYLNTKHHVHPGATKYKRRHLRPQIVARQRRHHCFEN